MLQIVYQIQRAEGLIVRLNLKNSRRKLFSVHLRTCYFVAPRLPPTLPPYRSDNGVGYASKNYLKWRANQLAIQCMADTVNYLE